MKTLPQTSPSAFCTAFIERELADYKKTEIWMSAWPTMERVMKRKDELEIAFEEIINRYGYSDKFDLSANQSSKEAVWCVFLPTVNTYFPQA